MAAQSIREARRQLHRVRTSRGDLSRMLAVLADLLQSAESGCAVVAAGLDEHVAGGEVTA